MSDESPLLDQIDVVLGEWANERPQADLAPVAITARVSRLAQILQQRSREHGVRRAGIDEHVDALVAPALRTDADLHSKRAHRRLEP